jgi:hydrogenase-4 component B
LCWTMPGIAVRWRKSVNMQLRPSLSSPIADRLPTRADGDTLPSVSDPILLFLAVDAVALLLLGTFAAALPLAAGAFLAMMASGLGILLCLPPLLIRGPATTFGVPVGPPGLSLHLALDQLSACFLVIVFVAGTAIAAFQATATPPPRAASMRMTVFGVAGAALAVLAADGVILAIGLAVSCGAILLPGSASPLNDPPTRDRRRHAALLFPLLVMAAVCLLTPAGFAPNFDAIRTVPVDPDHATAAAALTIAAVAGLAWRRSTVGSHTRDALTAGVLVPLGSYLLLRLIVDLSGGATRTWCGFVLLLAGGTVAVIEGWRAALHPDIDGSVSCLLRRQAGLAAAGVGLALIARAADLPGAASLALDATFLSAIGASVAGVLTSIAAQAMGAGAGTFRLSHLGGLVHTMPRTSAALAAGLLGLSALPPGLGFASLWLLLEALLSAPRTGGLLFQLPFALTGAAVALSAALATAASVRLIGVALLGRPRTPRGTGAHETRSPSQTILQVLAALSLLAGILPGLVLSVLAGSAIRALTGAPPVAHIGLALLSPSSASPSYLALPVFGLVALATVAAMLVPRWSPKEGKAAGLWADGMEPPAGFPFGEPAAQSAGNGFLPAFPDLVLPRLPPVRLPRSFRAPSAAGAMWLLLAAFGVLLLILALLE